MANGEKLPNDNDDFDRGYHGIPDNEDIAAMSFVELASQLSSCAKDSAKFHVIEREMKRRIAKDQAEINRPNIIIAGVIGGVFGLTGVALGFFLNSFQPTSKQVTPASTVQQTPGDKLHVQPSVGNFLPSNPPASQAAKSEPPTQGNAPNGNKAP